MPKEQQSHRRKGILIEYSNCNLHLGPLAARAINPKTRGKETDRQRPEL